MTDNIRPVRHIASPEEREVVQRYASGHDTLRIAAEFGRKPTDIATVIGKICGFDRGRAAQQVRAYDADHRPSHPTTTNPRIAELETQVCDLRAALQRLQNQLNDAQAELVHELGQASRYRRELVIARWWREYKERKLAATEQRLSMIKRELIATLERLNQALDAGETATRAYADHILDLMKNECTDEELRSRPGPHSQFVDGMNHMIEFVEDVLRSRPPHRADTDE